MTLCTSQPEKSPLLAHRTARSTSLNTSLQLLPFHLKQTRFFETLWQECRTCQVNNCVTGRPTAASLINLPPSLDFVHCRHIRPRCSIHLSTTLVDLIITEHLPSKDSHNRRERHIEAHSINLAHKKTSVLWKNHARFRHHDSPYTQVFHQLPSLETWLHGPSCSSPSSEPAMEHDTGHLPATVPLQHAHVSTAGLSATSRSSKRDTSSWTSRVPGSPADLTLLPTTHSRLVMHSMLGHVCLQPHPHIGALLSRLHSQIVLERSWFHIKHRTQLSLSLLQTLFPLLVHTFFLFKHLRPCAVTICRLQRRED